MFYTLSNKTRIKTFIYIIFMVFKTSFTHYPTKQGLRLRIISHNGYFLCFTHYPTKQGLRQYIHP